MEQLAESAKREGLAIQLSSGERVNTILNGRYELKKLLGEGGFGAVYRAYDRNAKTDVAVKLMKPRRRGAAEGLENFKAEAHRVVKLRHPNIVQWLNLEETESGSFLFVMEFLKGEDLEQLLAREGPLPVRRVQRLMLQMLAALEHAHQRDDDEDDDWEPILHLDLKPTNVFVTKDDRKRDRVKLIDFGIGGYSPEYAAPEVFRVLREPDAPGLDGRADLYSFGIIAYEMLTGRGPFAPPEIDDEDSWAQLHLNAPVRPITGVRGHRELKKFVEQCIDKDRDRRFADTRTAHERLERIADTTGGTVLKVAAGAIALLLAVLFWFRPLEDLDLTIDESALVSNQTLHFGPQRQEFEVAVRNRKLDGAWAIVSDPEDGEPVGGWLVEPIVTTSGQRLRIRAHPDHVNERNDLAYIVLGSLGRQQKSVPLRLWYHAPDSWSMPRDQIGIPLRDSKFAKWLLDAPPDGYTFNPEGQYLEIPIDGPDEVLQDLVVVVQEGTKQERAASRIQGLKGFRFPLDPIGPSSGLADTQLEVRARDRGGNTRGESFRIPVDRRPLFGNVSIPALENDDGSYFAYGDKGFDIAFHPSRPVTIVATLANKDGGHETSFTWSGGPDRLEENLDLGVQVDSTLDLSWDLSAHNLLGGRQEQAETKGERSLVIRYWASDPRFGVQVGDVDLNFDTPQTPIVYLTESTPKLSVVRQVAGKLRISGNLNGTPLAIEQPLLRTTQRILAIPIAGLQPGPNDLNLDGKYILATGSEQEELEGGVFHRQVQLHFDPEPEVLVLALAPTTREFLGRGSDLDDTQVHWTWRQQNVETPLEDLHFSFAGRTSENLASQEPPLSLRTIFPSLHVDVGEEGEYTLTAKATDKAGRTIPAALPSTLSIATVGPRLKEVQYRKQGQTKLWGSEDNKIWTVTLMLEDANGVNGVEGALTSGSMSEPVSFSGADDEWVGSVQLDHRWSGAAVELQLKMWDRNGLSATDTRTIDLVRIDPALPRTIRASLAAGSSAGPSGGSVLHLVAGNAGTPYSFLGRDRKVEEAAYRDAVYLSSGSPGKWDLPGTYTGQRIRLEPGAIQPFYLDETEVTVGEFRRVVLAGGISGSPPDLDGVTDDLPVTGITWQQAADYARFCRKRLPTLEEWEFAVRGPEYRLSSVPQSATDPAVNINSDGATRVHEGADATPEGIRNLCSNVAEWTSTLGPLSRIVHGSAPDGEVRYFAAGGNWHGSRCDFWSRQDFAEGETRSWIGFRCALDWSDALNGVDNEREGELSVTVLRGPEEN
ncbi:MAG: protein kinase [bacterium]|nr:protein kinase [bacterium]